MMSKISRRDFLKIGGSALGGLAIFPAASPLNEFADGKIVRVATTHVSVYSQPTDESLIVGQVTRDQLLNVYEEVNSGTPGYNPVWYRVWGGYVHRARMQKVEFIYNPIASQIRENGQLAEVTVPYTQALRQIGKEWQAIYRLYYTSVHWVTGVFEGPDGAPWYTLLDELLEIKYSVPAQHLRLIPDEELAPISPAVPLEQKRIVVEIPIQKLTCFEADQAVFSTSISSGRLNSQPGPNGIPTRTPAGDFRILVKMPSKHMGQGNLSGDIEAYVLPGVAWTSFFTTQGHAFHSAYWHDNFGVPMSSGCINMRPEEAKWLFRWSQPVSAVADIDPKTLDRKGYGTAVQIIA